MAHTVGDVSRMARISVRTLHHYDQIGLVKPRARSEAGYRLYSDGDVERLQQVLFYRELGFRLEEIGRILADPDFDRRGALVDQRELLAERAERTRALVTLIDRTLSALDGGEKMTPEALFDGFEPSEHEEEARERWGGTPEYEESRRRTSRYTQEDWKAIKAEAGAIVEAFGAAFEAGTAATDPGATDVAERHRQHISRWFYTCSYEVHIGLGEVYVADPRFGAAMGSTESPGLDQYILSAIRANAERASA
jgi:DNA-binding transcriptional MerR regulator